MKANTLTIYNASAGSGKTYTLVQSYLEILFKSDTKLKFKDILAITFTNKAADEMKSRVIEKIALFTKDTTLDPKNEEEEKAHQELINFANHINITPLNVHKRAKIILFEILHHYGALSINTIDKFTHKVIRSFSMNLGLPLNFEIELDSSKIIEEAVDLTFADLKKTDLLTKFLIETQIYKINNNSRKKVIDEIKSEIAYFFYEINIEQTKEFKESKLIDFVNFKKILQEKIKTLNLDIKKIGTDFFTEMNRFSYDETGFSKDTVPIFFKKLKRLELQKEPYSTAIHKIFQGESSFINKNNYLTKSSSAILEIIQQKIEAYYSVKSQLDLSNLLLQSTTTTAIFNEVQKNIINLKAENNILFISDFNQMINNEIKTQPVPYIYEKIGERFKHFFIDEFQDTSPIQWQNLEPLTKNALAGDGNTMLVGDIKQAIYAFRGGDSSLMMNLINKPKYHYQTEIIDLETNYRSKKNIIEFNNLFFTTIADLIEDTFFKDFYLKGSQMNTNSKKGGYVELNSTDHHDEIVLEQINDLTDRGYRFKDIAILTKTNQNDSLIELLLENKIPISSAESLKLENNLVIHLLIHTLKYLSKFNDLESKFELLTSLINLKIIAVSEENTDAFLQQALTQEKFNFLTDFNIHLPEEIIFSLYDTSENIIKQFGLNKSHPVYTKAFLNMIYEYGNTSNQDLHSFLDYWEQNKSKLALQNSSEIDAIKLMTIHKSKGLEFKAVILHKTDWNYFKPKKYKKWIDLSEFQDYPFNTFKINHVKSINNQPIFNFIGEKNKKDFKKDYNNEIKQGLNTLYVALTRAESELYVNFYKPKREQEFSIFKFIDYFMSKKSEGEKYIFGKKITLELNKKENKKNSGFTSSNYSEKIKIAKTSSRFWLPNEINATTYGNIFHKAMSKIEKINDVDYAIATIENEGLLNKETKESLIQNIQEIISSNEISEFFNGDITVYNEREFTDENGNTLIPDRLVKKENNWYLFDYKTGKDLVEHKIQLDNYATQLQKIGINIAGKYILNVENKLCIIPVD